MSATATQNHQKVTTKTFRAMKLRGEKISMLTAYDYSMAAILDSAGIDAILVGDSAANVMAGYSTTLPITIEEMIYHARSVVRAAKRAMVIVDMPFGTCSGDPMHSLKSAIKIMKETGAEALKIEGGEELLPDIKKIINAGIPVLGHLGLMPQSVNKFGGYGLRAKTGAEATKLRNDALLLQEAGCFAITFEKVPASLAKEISSELTIPVIGIGAGAGTDGQVLVVHDMLGINRHPLPKFVRKYANLASIIEDAVTNYHSDVKQDIFPASQESY